MFIIEYLTEIFGHLSSLNSNIEDRNERSLILTDELVAFTKIALWRNKIKVGNLDLFPLVCKAYV